MMMPQPDPLGLGTVESGSRLSRWLDGVAVSASALCLVHCLALPLLIAFLPIFKAGSSDWTHVVLLGFAVPVSAVALLRGRGSAGWRPLAVGISGLLLMSAAVVFFGDTPSERWLTVCGVSLVALAHILNWRSQHRRH